MTEESCHAILIVRKTIQSKVSKKLSARSNTKGGIITKQEGEHQVQDAIKNYEDIDSWKTIVFLYNAALKEIETKLEILNDEFQHIHRYNPIEHIKTRIKTPESIVKKLKRGGHEVNIESMIKYINDIAGVRLICSFTSDIYRLADMIGNQSDLKILKIKDYIKKPKDSGYKSYHMIVSVPIFLSDSVVETKVEIQIRTIAMDFWASLEHKIYYKFEGNAPEYISQELQECADMISDLDDKMLSLNEAIQVCLEEQRKEREMQYQERKKRLAEDMALEDVISETEKESENIAILQEK